MGMNGGCVGGGVGKTTTLVTVGVSVGGGGVAVGRAVWVSATPVYAAAMAVLCMSVMLGCAGAQATRMIIRNTMSI